MMRKAPPKRARSVPPVGTLVKTRFGTTDVLASVVEDRGPLGRGGRRLLRLRFLLEQTGDPVEAEVPEDELEIVALPSDPPDKRVGAEAVGQAWVGTYTAPDGRVAVVTDEMHTEEQARNAALHWIRVGLSEAGHRASGDLVARYVWKPDPRYPGRYAVFVQGRLGEERAR